MTGDAALRKRSKGRGPSPPANIALRVPGFVAAAMVAKYTDAVATLPLRVTPPRVSGHRTNHARTHFVFPQLFPLR
jgi:hypothetical protein